MEEACTSYAQLICEVDEVKALLVSNGIIEDINANRIFEKLERRITEPDRVREVVLEITAELNIRQPDLIIIDDDSKSPEVEVLVDVRQDNLPLHEVNRYGNKAKEIFELERGVKRSSGDGSFSESSKRTASDTALGEHLFGGTFPVEEVAVIKEIASLSTENVVPYEEPVEHKEAAELWKTYGTLNVGVLKVSTMPAKEISGPSEVPQTVASALPVCSLECVNKHVDKSVCEEGALNLTINAATGELNGLSAESGDAGGQGVKVSKEVERQVSNIEDIRPIHFNPTEYNVPYKVIPTLNDERAHSSTHEISEDTAKMLAQLDCLKAIMPNAESSYLKQVVRQFSGDEFSLNEFIRGVFQGDIRVPGQELLGEPEIAFENEVPSSSSKPPKDTPQRFEEVEVSGYPSVVPTVAVPQEDLQVDVVGSSDSPDDMTVGAASMEVIQFPSAQDIINVEIESDESDHVNADLYAKQLEYLIAVLPDADPTYLESMVKRLKGSEQMLKDFVANALENIGGRPTYPTREESQQKQEEEALVKRFTENFSVEDFLQVFPDPVAHFESVTRETACKHEYFVAYLRSKFRHLFVSDIQTALRKRKYNLTLAAQDLIQWKGIRRKSKRALGDCKWPKDQSIPFLQEVAYIENKDKILKYINDKKEQRQKTFDEAKANNQLLTCGCCFDDELLLEDMSTCREGHFFCKPCIKKGAEVIIGDGKSSFPCMQGECKAEFTLVVLQNVLEPAVFGKLVQHLQAEEVNAAGIEGLETCPSCPYCTIPAPEDKIFKCLNPDCMKETCRACKEPSHIPLRCDEVEKNSEIQARTYIENKMTEALVRTCWKCQKKFIKEGGCNKMTCSCGAMMCYICRQPVKDYKHFNPYPDRESKLCLLHSNDGQLNFEAVKAEAEKAKDEVMRQHPEMRLIHDPTLKLPEMPSTSTCQQFHQMMVPPDIIGDLVVGRGHANLQELLLMRRNRAIEHLRGRIRQAVVHPHRGRIVQQEPYPLVPNFEEFHQVHHALPRRNRAQLEDIQRHHVYPAPAVRNPARPYH